MMTRIVRAGVATLMTSALASIAQAADMRGPVQRPLPAISVFTWTGCYAGGQAGGQWAHATVGVNYPGDAVHGPVAASQELNSDGRFLYGGQIGCNWQQPGSSFVWGVEGDVIGLSRRDTSVDVFHFAALPADHFSTSERSNTQGSLRLRAGFAVDRALFYVAGGWTRARLEATHTVARDGVGSLSFDTSATRDGWNIGGGIEYAFQTRWTLGLEYRYTGYGSFTGSVPGGSAGTVTWSGFNVSADNLHTSDVRLRLNYVFGGLPGYRY